MELGLMNQDQPIPSLPCLLYIMAIIPDCHDCRGVTNFSVNGSLGHGADGVIIITNPTFSFVR
jgi:hypothetical protein